MSDLMTVNEAAAALGVTPGLVRRFIHAHRLPARTLGTTGYGRPGRWVLDPEDVAAFGRLKRPNGGRHGAAPGLPRSDL